MDSEFNLAFLKVKDILYDLAGQNDLLFLDLAKVLSTHVFSKVVNPAI